MCVSNEKMNFRMVNSNKQFLFISFLRVYLGFRVCARHSISTLADWACQVEAISSASERAWRHGDWGLVSATLVLLPTRAARAAPALNQLRLLGFSFLNSFSSFLCLTNRNSAALCAVVGSRFQAQSSRPLLRLVG